MGIEPRRSDYIPCYIQVLQEDKSIFATISPPEEDSDNTLFLYPCQLLLTKEITDRVNEVLNHAGRMAHLGPSAPIIKKLDLPPTSFMVEPTSFMVEPTRT
jgi:hypothetical protein